MKIRTDFVTNSSSSSFVFEIKIKKADGKTISYGSEANPDYEMRVQSINVKTDPQKLANASSIDELIEMIATGITENYGDPFNGWGFSDFLGEIKKVGNMDNIMSVFMSGEQSIPLGSDYYKLEAIYHKTTDEYLYREKGEYFDEVPNGGSGGEWLCNLNGAKESKTLRSEKKVAVETITSTDVSGLSVKGKTFVVTGKVEKFANREALKKAIIDAGGKFGSSITEKTDYLINNDKTSSSTKNLAARNMGIPIISEEDFLKMLEFSSESLKVEEQPYEEDHSTTPTNDNVFDGVVSPNEDFKIVKGVLKKYLGNRKVVVIPKGIKAIDKSAFAQKAVVSVLIPESVEEIREHAFNKCKELSCVVFQGKTTQLGNKCFGDCVSLKEINLPIGLRYIGERAFYNCQALTNIIIPEGVNYIDLYPFEKCKNLEFNVFEKNLYLGNHNNPYLYLYKGVSNKIHPETKWIGSGAFELYKQNRPIILPEGLEKSINAYAFYNCKWLTYFKIPDSVTVIGDGAFRGCESLTSITIPDSVTSIGKSAFSFCKSLTSITIPDSVTSIGDSAFSFCKSLTSITIPDSITSISECGFSCCSSLTSITIPDSVMVIEDGAFLCCESLTSITIPDSVTSIGGSAFMDCSSLTSITIPDSVTSIGRLAFWGCRSLTSITIPDSVTSIGDSAFWSCHKLVIYTAKGSCADKYAKKENLKVVYI